MTFSLHSSPGGEGSVTPFFSRDVTDEAGGEDQRNSASSRVASSSSRRRLPRSAIARLGHRRRAHLVVEQIAELVVEANRSRQVTPEVQYAYRLALKILLQWIKRQRAFEVGKRRGAIACGFVQTAERGQSAHSEPPAMLALNRHPIVTGGRVGQAQVGKKLAGVKVEDGSQELEVGL